MLRNTKVDGKTIILGAILILLSCNFNGDFYKLFLLFIAVCFFCNPTLKFTTKCLGRVLLLLTFSCIYLLTVGGISSLSMAKIVVVMSLPIAYYLGYNFNSNKNYKDWKTPIFLVIIGLALHGFLNLIINFNTLLGGVRTIIDFWLGKEQPMTTHIALFILMAGCTYYIFFALKFKKSPILKSFLIVLFICGLVYNVLGATRTVIYSMILNISVCFVVVTIKYQKTSNKKVNYICTVALIVGALWTIYYFNILNIRTMIESTPLVQRIQRLNDLESGVLSSRGEQITEAFKQMFIHPWGGYTMKFHENLDFIHNMWLNVAYAAGVIPCLLLFIYCLCVIKDSFTLLRLDADRDDVIFVLGMYVAVLVYWFIEPVFEAVTYNVTLFCFINGIVHKRIDAIRKEAQLGGGLCKRSETV